MSTSVYVSTYVNTYGDTLGALRDFHREQEAEKQLLLNTIALAEAELAKPEYFGFLIESDRMGYLEALSQTKTTFRGINPHDPLNGIVVNGEINPDFVMMLEKNFFKENSENLDKDELYFVRYQAERDKMIEWLKSQFKELSINDEYLIKEIGISQEDLFQRLQANTLIFSTKVENKEFCLIDSCMYIEGVNSQRFHKTIPQKFCPNSEKRSKVVNLSTIFEEKKKENIRKKQEQEERERIKKEREENVEYRKKLKLGLVVVAISICIIVIAKTILN